MPLITVNIVQVYATCVLGLISTLFKFPQCIIICVVIQRDYDKLVRFAKLTLQTESCIYFKTKDNPTTHFLKVRYTCTLYSGMQGSIYEKKKTFWHFFYPKGAEVLYLQSFFNVIFKC